jgi:hypothetical protein
MTTPSSPPPPTQAPATVPSPIPRQPLGLPEGSVRALLAIMVFGTIWALLLIHEDKPASIPLYLYYLMFLILGSYFAARRHHQPASGVRQSHPLHLPRGTLRFLMIVGFIAAIGWGFYSDPHFLDRLNPLVTEQPYLPVVVVGAFFLGILIARFGERVLAGPTGVPPWSQDVLAWVSLLAMLGLGAEVLIQLVINPTLSQPLKLPPWEGILAGLVAFYFGARS